jgi:hypothetical protein
LAQPMPGACVAHALHELLRNDLYLLEVSAHERSISHRLGMYLQRHFPQYSVDCEYNRVGDLPKRLENILTKESHCRYPDIIVHTRGSKEAGNFLIIEIKLAHTDERERDENRRIDQEKLAAYRNQLKYHFALFIEFGVGMNAGEVFVKWDSA